MNSSIGKFFNIIGTVTLLVLIIALYFVNEIKVNTKLFLQLEDNRYNSRVTVDILRQSSDDLTRFARQYVVTNNEEYKENYIKILHIRNGDLSLPKDYNNIYWDLSEEARQKYHPNGKKTSFNFMIKNLVKDEYEIKKFEEAHQNSDDLVNLELEAFNAMVGLYKDKNGNFSIHDTPNQQKAIKILHSTEYLEAKEKIMFPIDELLRHFDRRTDKELTIFKEKIASIQQILSFVSLLLVVLFLISIFLIRKKVIIPIKYLTQSIHSIRLKENPDKKIFFNDEIGYMTKEFFDMSDELVKDLHIINTSKRNMEEYITLIDKNIITSTTDLKGNITDVSEAFAQISGYTKKELIGKNHRIVKHKDMPESLYKDLWETISKDQKWNAEVKNKTKDGDFYWVNVTIYPNYDENGEKKGYTAIKADITLKKQIEELLSLSKLSENKIQKYVELIDKNIITSSTDISGKINYVSEAFASISGYAKDELIGKNHRVVKHEDNDPFIYENLWETISNNRIWHGIIKNKKKDGGFYWVEATIYPTFDDLGEKTGYTAVRIDITDKKKIEDMSIKDALTDIYNRRYFNEMMPKAINIAKRDKTYFSFVIIDIDFFKQYNDTYGHQSGDNVIIEVAKTLEKSLQRASDMCFRLGGEEFGAIFNALNPREAYNLADSVRKNIEDLKIEHKNSQASEYLTVSMGMVTANSFDDNSFNELLPDKLYKDADDLLYKAKENGRNRLEAK